MDRIRLRPEGGPREGAVARVASPYRRLSTRRSLEGVPWKLGRAIVVWVVLAAVAGVVAMSVVDGLNGPQGGAGADWGLGLTEALLTGTPLVAVAVGLRSSSRATARRTAVAAFVLALIVTFVLVSQLLDRNEILRDRLVQGLALSVYLMAAVVELPAFTGRWPSRPPMGRT